MSDKKFFPAGFFFGNRGGARMGSKSLKVIFGIIAALLIAVPGGCNKEAPVQNLP